MKKTIVWLALLGLAAVIGEFLLHPNQLPEKTELSEMKVKVIMPMLTTEYEAYFAGDLVTYLKDYGFAQVDCVSYELDTLKAIEVIENCIVEGVELICMYPMDNSTAAIQQRAIDEGIGVITMGSDNHAYDYLVRMDHVKMGKLIAEMSYSWIMRNLPKGSQIATVGTNINLDMQELTDALNKRLEELVGEDYEIVEMAVLDGSGQDAMRYMEGLLERWPKIQAVAACNDSYAIAAAEYFRLMGRVNQNIGVFGCGATPQAVKQIRENGVMRGTILTGDSARKVADAAYSWANDALNGERIGYTFNIPLTIDNIRNHS